eukprot:TRINITY_DN40543_c0_g1_i1.p1 TRINITY_DN40543_c0_g1~~TRINITY_DN40543_c0_g1_i1.p1  ORF type:complete len:529 (+),score=174.18 TRINITY_DN40543_c0_g1_i1:61-1587(+)
MKAAVLLAATGARAASPLRPKMSPAADAELRWVQTTQTPRTYLEPQVSLTLRSMLQPAANGSVVVDTSTRYQTIEGFGGALTESAAYVVRSMNGTTQQAIFDAYYSEEGHRYTMARTHIASCDFALGYYSYQDVDGEFDMKSFNMSRDHQLLIPLIQEAQKAVSAAGGQFKLVSSPWSPPKWIKTCDSLMCPEIPGSCGLKKEEAGKPYRSAYALYLSKYLAEMEANGIKPWAITPQNEPQACKITMESTSISADEERDFIRDQLGPMLKKQHPSVKLLAYDHNKDNIVKWANTILGDNATAPYVDGVAFHWYSSHDYFDHLDAVHSQFPGTMLLATEATEGKDIGHYKTNQSWEKGEHYGRVIMGDLNSFASGWIDWNIILDMKGGPTHPGPKECEGVIKCGDDAMLIADTQYPHKDTVEAFYPQVFYWYMGHFSRYVSPGSVRVGAANGAAGVGVFTAVTPDKQVVVVAMNEGDAAESFTLFDKASSRGAEVTLPPHSIHTYWYSA